MKKLAGFTLIELMIVVAIIGILAAIAIPAYKDYITRSQVTEAMSLTSGVKTAFAAYFSEYGGMPTAISVVSSARSGKYVSYLTIADSAGGTIDILAIFKNSNISADIQGSTFAIATTDGGQNWDCGNVGEANNTTAINSKFLPGACK